jgi:alpha-galactosidase
VNVQLLAADAAINGDTEALVQSIAMDPLAGAVCTLKEIRDMTSEMLEAERKWLPQFKGRKVAPRPAVNIPAGVKAIDLAQDPAQAILKRFMDLAEKK